MTDQYEKIANAKIAQLEAENARLTATVRELRSINVEPGISLGKAHDWKQERDALATRCRELEADKARLESLAEALSLFFEMSERMIIRTKAEWEGTLINNLTPSVVHALVATARSAEIIPEYFREQDAREAERDAAIKGGKP